jgi:hypothetical protein
LLTQELEQVSGDIVPLLSGFLPGQRGQDALAGDGVHLVDGVQDQAEDALLLEQVLPISQGLEVLLTLLVAWKRTLELLTST